MPGTPAGHAVFEIEYFLLLNNALWDVHRNFPPVFRFERKGLPAWLPIRIWIDWTEKSSG